MTPEKYVQLLQKFIDRKFNSKQDAAAAFKCSPALVSHVLNGKRSPTILMLEATGHKKIESPSIVSYWKVKS